MVLMATYELRHFGHIILAPEHKNNSFPHSQTRLLGIFFTIKPHLNRRHTCFCLHLEPLVPSIKCQPRGSIKPAIFVHPTVHRCLWAFASAFSAHDAGVEYPYAHCQQLRGITPRARPQECHSSLLPAIQSSKARRVLCDGLSIGFIMASLR